LSESESSYSGGDGGGVGGRDDGATGVAQLQGGSRRVERKARGADGMQRGNETSVRGGGFLPAYLSLPFSSLILKTFEKSLPVLRLTPSPFLPPRDLTT